MTIAAFIMEATRRLNGPVKQQLQKYLVDLVRDKKEPNILNTEGLLTIDSMRVEVLTNLKFTPESFQTLEQWFETIT